MKIIGRDKSDTPQGLPTVESLRGGDTFTTIRNGSIYIRVTGGSRRSLCKSYEVLAVTLRTGVPTALARDRHVYPVQAEVVASSAFCTGADWPESLNSRGKGGTDE